MARRKGWISVSSSLGGAAIMQSSVGKNQGRVGRPVREMIIIVAIRIILVIMDIRILLTITIKDEMDTYYLYHAPERY